MPALNRRATLLGVAGVGLAGLGAVVAVERDALPGRPWLHERLGLNGEDGPIPAAAPGRIIEGSFESSHRKGKTGWAIAYPPGGATDLPVVVALHQLGADHGTAFRSKMRVDRFLAAYVDQGGTPFAIATIDGGTTYWHPREDGEDTSAMVVEEFLPLLAARRLRTERIGLMGWSMGGYGALRLAGLLGLERVTSVTAAGPALRAKVDDFPSGFESAAAYKRHTIFGHQSELAGIPVRIDCGEGDPFFRDVVKYANGFDHKVTTNFEPGGHDPGFWRRVQPAQLAFHGAHLD
jgi:S-formylglutathione hydrolase FrmB